MKYPLKSLSVNLAIAAVTFLASCKKENSLSSTNDPAIVASAVSQTQAIAVSASTTTAGDSVYVINTCSPNSIRDTTTFGSLPSSITGYLTENYSGYTFQKAFTIKDTTGPLQGYIVIIQFNDNPVGLKFDATGTFVNVLEQREGHDLLGNRWHEGGRFDGRDGKERDTIELTALPAAITSYLTSNYATDTLVRSSATRDSGYIVLSKNNGLFATVFNASGEFISRVELPAPRGEADLIDQSALPANVLSYLSATYPGYVFNKAFSISANGVVQGYAVVIEANNTKYGILFDAAGSFVTVKSIR